jgi:hypothetical protein
MVEKRTSDQDRLLDQTLAFLKDAITNGETKTAVPPVQFRGSADPKEVLPPEPPVQADRTASLIAHALSLVENVAVSESTAAEAPSPSLQQPVTKQPPKDVLPSEPPIQEQRPASLIDHARFLVENVAVAEPKEPETPSPMQQPVAKQTSKDVLPSEPPVQEGRAASLIDHALSMVEIVGVPKLTAAEAASPSFQQPVVKQPSPKERLDMERTEIRKRVATFKANQQRFQREREEYYATTMAKARATQRNPPGDAAPK